MDKPANDPGTASRATASEAHPEVSDEQFLALIGRGTGTASSAKLDALRFLREDDPALVPLAAWLMTTGSATARAAATAVLAENFDDLVEACEGPDRGPSWREANQHLLNPHPRELATLIWAGGGALGELGLRVKPEWWRAIGSRMSFCNVTISAPDHDPGADWVEHWRGMAILDHVEQSSQIEVVYGNEDPTDEEKRTAREFVRWAGAHPDARLVASTAIERETLSVETLKAITAEKTAAPPALGDGTL